ncbi:MAG: hypothetical protein ACQEP1_04140, partial [Nanobdellota archaeon]
MVDQSLVNYVRTYLSQGYTRQQIQQALISYGYDNQTVIDAFKEDQRQRLYLSTPPRVSQPVEQRPVHHEHNVPKRNVLLMVGVIIFIALAAFLVIYFVQSGPSTTDPSEESPSGTQQEEDDLLTNDEVTDEDDESEEQNKTDEKTVNDTEEESDDELFSPKKGKIELFEYMFCDEIDQFYNCFENKEGVFRKGDKVYLMFKLHLKSQEVKGINKIGFFEDREVIDPRGNVINNLSYDNVMDVTREVKEPGKFSLPVYNTIQTDNSTMKGKYT